MKNVYGLKSLWKSQCVCFGGRKLTNVDYWYMADADAVTPSINTRSYTIQSVPSCPIFHHLLAWIGMK